MADIEQAIYSILSTDATTKALVGTRIYPNVVPQDATLPAIAYQRISGSRVQSHGGPSNLARPRFQFTCLAVNYSGARAVANAVRQALDGYKNTAASVYVQAGHIQTDFDSFADGENLHAVRVDFYLWHTEA
jgi:hypothetical protein